MPPSAPVALLRSVAEGAVRTLFKRRLYGSAPALGDAASGCSSLDALPPYDVVVVGAGVMGSATAYALASRNQRVACLEQYDCLHRRGSSHGESRIIRLAYPQAHLTALMAHSYELWEAAQAEFGSRVFTRTGGLDFSEAGDPALLRLVAALVAHGVAHERLSPEQVSARFPAFRLPSGFEAVYQPDAGVLNASKSVAMLQELARRKGAHVLDRTRVLSVEPLASGGVRVQTSRGALRAAKVVLAAGAWTAHLLRGFGAGDAAGALSVVPVAASYWRIKDAASAAHLAADVCPVSIRYSGAAASVQRAECYLIPTLELPGLVKVSLHLPQHLWGPPLANPDERSMAPPLDVVQEHVAPFVAQHLPGVDSSAPALVEPCLYTMTPDGEFVIDSVHPDVWLASPCSGHGFKFAPLIGAMLADLVLTGSTPYASADVLQKFGLARLQRQPAARL